jgi:hypothetical protein
MSDEKPEKPVRLEILVPAPRMQQWLRAAWIKERGSLRGYPFKLKHVTEES